MHVNTPPLGWNTWNTFAANINEQLILESADAMVENGLLDAGWAPVDSGESPEKHALRQEVRRSLQAFIRELPEDMRAAVVLRDVEGYSYDEIADILEANVGTIKSRISRGREKLREKIAARPELFDRVDV